MTGGSLQEVLDDTRSAYAAKVAQLTSLLHLPATEAIAQQAARPITDMRGSSAQRKRLCRVLVRRALERAVERAKGK